MGDTPIPAGAVVGMVEASGVGDRAKSEDQPHAKQLAHAPKPVMRCSDPAREPLLVAGDAERPLPAARRPVAGRADGQKERSTTAATRPKHSPGAGRSRPLIRAMRAWAGADEEE